MCFDIVFPCICAPASLYTPLFCPNFFRFLLRVLLLRSIQYNFVSSFFPFVYLRLVCLVASCPLAAFLFFCRFWVPRWLRVGLSWLVAAMCPCCLLRPIVRSCSFALALRRRTTGGACAGTGAAVQGARAQSSTTPHLHKQRHTKRTKRKNTYRALTHHDRKHNSSSHNRLFPSHPNFHPSFLHDSSNQGTTKRIAFTNIPVACGSYCSSSRSSRNHVFSTYNREDILSYVLWHLIDESILKSKMKISCVWKRILSSFISFSYALFFYYLVNYPTRIRWWSFSIRSRFKDIQTFQISETCHLQS